MGLSIFVICILNCEAGSLRTETYAEEAGKPGTTKSDEEDPFPEVSSDDWRLMLVNKQHPIPEDFEVELGRIHNGHMVDRRITGQLDEMLSAAKEDGVKLLVISPYRTTAKQKQLFDKKVKKAMKQGMSYLQAYKETAQVVTIPGFSEHETGLAVDLSTKDHITLDAEYSETEGGKWLSKHCAEYGFILRYPVGKEEITGIEFEPWHFRYVGKKAATYIMDHDLTLEEFVHQLREKEAKDGKVDSKENNEETKQSKKFEKKDQNTSR